ncbi:hypothetical protein R9C00_01910 [Flammeovirgaceae bacterium SG7u.111]|nr:hypothetical protein [Flammeovirgaceae bacterium SG7u.132]WPO36197.1 hypothetical protein R9C00_01910 [Flammeovirgaceae bacterium SG7u.111]
MYDKLQTNKTRTEVGAKNLEKKPDATLRRKEIELVLKMISTDYKLAKSFWGEGFSLDTFYEMHPEKHPLNRYVNQLVNDLEHIRKNYVLPDLLEKLGYYDNENTLSSLPAEEEEEFLDEESFFEEKLIDTTFENLIGIEKIAFPPMEKLCESQIQKLSFIFQKLLNSLGIDFMAPSYRDDYIYVLLRKHWDNRPIAISDLGNYVTWMDKMEESMEKKAG